MIVSNGGNEKTARRENCLFFFLILVELVSYHIQRLMEPYGFPFQWSAIRCLFIYLSNNLLSLIFLVFLCVVLKDKVTNPEKNHSSLYRPSHAKPLTVFFCPHPPFTLAFQRSRFSCHLIILNLCNILSMGKSKQVMLAQLYLILLKISREMENQLIFIESNPDLKLHVIGCMGGLVG